MDWVHMITTPFDGTNFRLTVLWHPSSNLTYCRNILGLGLKHVWSSWNCIQDMVRTKELKNAQRKYTRSRTTSRTQTSAVPNARNVRQSSKAWNSLCQNVPECSLLPAGTIWNISWKSIRAFFSIMLLTDRQADMQTNRQTNRDENINFAVWRR